MPQPPPGPPRLPRQLPPAAPAPPAPPTEPAKGRIYFGTTRRQRMKFYLLFALLLVVGFAVWAFTYLQPSRWYKYTDHVSFEQVARDVQVGHVVWEPAAIEVEGSMEQPTISSDSTRMVYSDGKEGGDANLFLRRWDGTNWGKPRPMRALNSAFHETAPAISGDGKFLFFASDRPGGRGGNDIWVAKWDGVEFAWPLPLTTRVNSAFDETDPALSPDSGRLYFSSNRPYISEEAAIMAAHSKGTDEPLAEVGDQKGDFDIYAADLAGDTPFDLIIERQMSMLYSLRKGALADTEVMRKLGGSKQTESAIDRGLEYIASTQEKDGRWDIRKSGGQNGHDVAATSFALLAFYGRGERHDQDCKYRDVVAAGLKWLVNVQDGASGDMRGDRPQHNAMYDQGIASLALIEAYGVTKDPALRPRAIAAIEFMTDTQHEGGGWRYKPGDRGDLSVTGWYIMALASAKMSGIPVPEKTYKGSIRFLEFVSGGQYGGSYGYTDPPGKRGSNRPGMNAAGFFCSLLVGNSPNAANSWEASKFLGQTALRHNDLYYFYYGTVAAYQYQGPLWRGWREPMQKRFVQSQGRDGSWHPGGGHGGGMGKIIGTALTVLCLEAHYRYTPLYGLGYEPDPEGPAKGTLQLSDLPDTPLFRHAKHLPEFSSPANDNAPVITDHGDFIYFASEREGGFGGSDIYRSRISGPVAGDLQNLGEEVNSEGNETDPAVRMAGFHLMFNSDRDGDESALFTAKSRRLDKQHSVFKLPSFGWIGRNLLWMILFAGGAASCFFLTRRALAQGKTPPEKQIELT